MSKEAKKNGPQEESVGAIDIGLSGERLRNTQVRTYARPWLNQIDFLLFCDPLVPGDKRYVGNNITFVPWELDTAPDNPTFSLDLRHVQVLMDELWRCGFRPTSGEGSVGQLAATERHLGDMRDIVENVLDLKFSGGGRK